MLDDRALAFRSIQGFGEMVAALGRWGIGPEAEVRRAGVLGARIATAQDNPWFDAVVVLPGKTPPPDDPSLPHCLWTLADSAPGRVEEANIATPCLGVALDDPAWPLQGHESQVISPSLETLGDVNERAYGQFGVFGPLVRALRDDRIRTHGLYDGNACVSVALTISVGDDLSIHYVATEASHRRRGLASRLIRSVLATARARGMRSASLQASAEGLPVWQSLGFRRVATLRGYLRPESSA